MPNYKNLKSGDLVQLTSQDEKSVCHFTDAADRKHTLPSHEFYAKFEGATAADLPTPRPAPKAADELAAATASAKSAIGAAADKVKSEIAAAGDKAKSAIGAAADKAKAEVAAARPKPA